MILLEGPFLLLGLVAWTLAIVTGVGAWLGAWSWHERWSWAGGLAGLGSFGLLLYAQSGLLPVLVPSARWVVFSAAALFVGCGLAAAYGTLFPPTRAPVLPRSATSAERRLWVLDQIDRLRPERVDWLLTALMLAPCAGLAYFGLVISGSAGLAVLAGGAALGPAWASASLLRRSAFAADLEAALDAPAESAPSIIATSGAE
ncbi:MAG: hypothetical protein AAF389_15335 [Gemmatimonadota bacterium]